MKYAVDTDHKRVYADMASPSENYFCSICKNKVILKSGSIREAHFAHTSNECTDTWTYEMSEWHQRMQRYFRRETTEVVVSHCDVKHRADVLEGNTVIEFQHSPISSEEFIDRNNFYRLLRLNIAWVFDVNDQFKNKQLYFDSSEKQHQMRWKYPLQVLKYAPVPKDNNSNFAVWLTWEDEQGVDTLYKVIWSSVD